MDEDTVIFILILSLIVGIFGGASWCVTTHKKCKRDVVNMCLATGHPTKECFSY